MRHIDKTLRLSRYHPPYRVHTSQITPLNPPDVLATVYIQVKLPPLIPPYKGGK